jgi:hypothetical protein
MQNESTRRSALVSFGLATIGAAAATSTAAAAVQHRSPKSLVPAHRR